MPWFSGKKTGGLSILVSDLLRGNTGKMGFWIYLGNGIHDEGFLWEFWTVGFTSTWHMCLFC